jgi:DNA-binding HxlR family transcriptional regulator
MSIFSSKTKGGLRYAFTRALRAAYPSWTPEDRLPDGKRIIKRTIRLETINYGPKVVSVHLDVYGKVFLHRNDIYYDSDTMAEATVEELVGYISGNVRRKQIVDVLDKNGNETFEALEKLTRTPRLMLEKALKDMTDRDVIKKQKDKYVLTEDGQAAAKILHSMR